MAAFLVYSLSTGAIDRTGSVPDGDEAMQGQPGEAVMLNPDGVTGVTHWVDLGPPPVLVAKADMGTSIDRTYIAAGGSQSATISDVPQGASLYVNGIHQTRVDDGEVSFAAMAIGTYALLLTHYRYLDDVHSVDVGIGNLTLAIEVEHAVNLISPLPIAVEAETALVGQQIRTTQLPIATETETAALVGMTITANLDPASEAEEAPGAGSSSPPAVETEMVNDAEFSRIVQLPEAVETETAFDAAA